MSVKRFKKGERVEFVAGNGKVYTGKFVRTFYPSPKAGPHYRIEVEGASGMVATVFATGKVGKSVKRVEVCCGFCDGNHESRACPRAARLFEEESRMIQDEGEVARNYPTRLAEIIWTASRGDESTISATGADIVARAVLASDWMARVRADVAATALEQAADRVWAESGVQWGRPDWIEWLRQSADRLRAAGRAT